MIIVSISMMCQTEGPPRLRLTCIFLITVCWQATCRLRVLTVVLCL